MAKKQKIRMAECQEHNPVTSNPSLAFFEDRSAGSAWTRRACVNDGYAPEAHRPEIRSQPHLARMVCEKFKAHPGMETDAYYCGCRGWD